MGSTDTMLGALYADLERQEKANWKLALNLVLQWLSLFRLIGKFEKKGFNSEILDPPQKIAMGLLFDVGGHTVDDLKAAIEQATKEEPAHREILLSLVTILKPPRRE